MIVVSALWALGYSNPFLDYVARSAQLLDQLSAFQMEVAVSTTLGNKTTKSRVVATINRPDSVLIRLLEPPQDEFDASDRSYLVSGTKMLAVDHFTNEYLRRNNIPKGTLAERLNFAAGDVGEPFFCGSSGEGLKGTMSRFARFGTWARSSAGAGTRFKAHNKLSKADLTVEFDIKGRLALVRMESPSGKSIWYYKYSPGGKATLSIPAGGRQVFQFTAKPQLPTFQDESARAAFSSAIIAYDRMRSFHVSIRTDEGSSTIASSGNNVRIDRPNATLWYTEKSTAIADRTKKKYYAGPSSPRSYLEAVGAAGTSLSGWEKWALLHHNPLRSLFSSAVSVRSAGTMSSQGRKYAILAAEGATVSGNLQFDTTTKLLASVTLKFRDAAKRDIVLVSNSTLTYKSVNQQIPITVFAPRCPPGFSSLPIRSLIPTPTR